MKKDTSGKTDGVRGGQGRGGDNTSTSSLNVPVPVEVWSTKKTSAMTKLHEASSEHAVWEEEEEEEATECPASTEI